MSNDDNWTAEEDISYELLYFFITYKYLHK